MILINFSAKSDTGSREHLGSLGICRWLLDFAQELHKGTHHVCMQAFFIKVTGVWQQPASEAANSCSHFTLHTRVDACIE